jgi:hypothetical protein
VINGVFKIRYGIDDVKPAASEHRLLAHLGVKESRPNCG